MVRYAQIIPFDDVTGVELCRDDRCPVLGLHVAHKIWGPGRPPKSCPACGGVVQAKNNLRFCRCGWFRTVRANKPKERRPRRKDPNR